MARICRVLEIFLIPVMEMYSVEQEAGLTGELNLWCTFLSPEQQRDDYNSENEYFQATCRNMGKFQKKCTDTKKILYFLKRVLKIMLYSIYRVGQK